jgi:hypothetical protein
MILPGKQSSIAFRQIEIRYEVTLESKQNWMSRVIGSRISCGLRIGAKYLNEGSFPL